jgi:hypothetical protein
MHHHTRNCAMPQLRYKLTLICICYSNRPAVLETDEIEVSDTCTAGKRVIHAQLTYLTCKALKQEGSNRQLTAFCC